MNGAVYLIHCLRPLHTGAGEGLGAIDRPIVREAHTGFPYVPASSIKGTARAIAEARKRPKEEITACFGPPNTRDNRESRQGALIVTDAQLLLFPVRSDAATWVWVTSPLILARLVRWCELAGQTDLATRASEVLSEATPDGQRAVCVTDDRVIRFSNGGPYAFADDAFAPVDGVKAREAMSRLAGAFATLLFPLAEAGQTGPAHNRYWHEFFRRRLVLVGDGVMSDLVQRFTAIEPGIEIEDDTGTTKDGSLRYTEFLPEESVLFHYLHIDEALAENFAASALSRFSDLVAQQWQLGADESKGKGLVRSVRVMEVKNAVTT